MKPVYTKASENDQALRESELRLVNDVASSPERRRFRVRIEMYDAAKPDDVLAEDAIGLDTICPNQLILLVEATAGPNEGRGMRAVCIAEFKSLYTMLRLAKLQHLDSAADSLYARIMMQAQESMQKAQALQKKVLIAGAGGMPR